jgi:putative endonuclease
MARAKIHLSRILLEILWGLGIPIPLRNAQTKGWFGEWLAKDYLVQKNFTILARNWHSPFDERREIDLVAMDGDCLVFIEVRARSESALNSGYFSLTHKKKKSLLNAFKDYLRKHDGQYPFYRFDVTEVDLETSWGKVFHHQNVSLFP